MLTVYPIDEFHGDFNLPSSKPETQRAILAASLADGDSTIKNDLRCLETSLMIEACRNMGAFIKEIDDELHITGNSNHINFKIPTINCQGAALIFRTFVALSCLSKQKIQVVGDTTLRKRIMSPLFTTLRDMGASFHFDKNIDHAPCHVISSKLTGGEYDIAGDISSQFITALLFTGPFLQKKITLNIHKKIYSKPYILQSLQQLESSGITTEYSKDLTHISVFPGRYQPINPNIGIDFTSASYLLLASALLPGTSIYRNFDLNSLQGEKIIYSIIKKLNINCNYNKKNKVLHISNTQGSLSGNFEVDLQDAPNIAPTLAILGAYIDGSFIVRGAKLTQRHKCPRITTIIAELRKAGVDIKPIYAQDEIDGFHIKGKKHYPGNITFNCYSDHRILMSLFIFSLKTHAPCMIAHDTMANVKCSFPEFFTYFNTNTDHHVVTEAL